MIYKDHGADVFETTLSCFSSQCFQKIYLFLYTGQCRKVTQWQVVRKFKKRFSTPRSKHKNRQFKTANEYLSMYFYVISLGFIRNVLL